MQSIYPDRQKDLTLWRLAHLLHGADPLAEKPSLPVQNELMSLAGAILNNELRVIFKDGKRVDFVMTMIRCQDGQFPKADLEGIYIRRQDWDAYVKSFKERPDQSVLSDQQNGGSDTKHAQFKHVTPELEIMYQAIAEFWENHDPARPPKKAAIVAWLIEKGLSGRIAEAMDSIIRTPAAKKGGNKST